MQYRRRQSSRSCAGGRGEEVVLESSAEGEGLREGELPVGGRRLPVLEAVFFIVVPAGVEPSRSLLRPFTPPAAAAAAPAAPLFFCFLLAGPSSKSSGSVSSIALALELALPLVVAPAGVLRSTDKSRTGSCVEERYPQTRQRTSDWRMPEKVRCIMQSQRREAKPSSDDTSCP